MTRNTALIVVDIQNHPRRPLAPERGRDHRSLSGSGDRRGRFPISFNYDGVTSARQVNVDLHDPLLCGSSVWNVASDDLSLPATWKPAVPTTPRIRS